jgi:hypothetical protein
MRRKRKEVVFMGDFCTTSAQSKTLAIAVHNTFLETKHA